MTKKTEEMYKAAGAAGEAFKKTQATFDVAVQQLKQNILVMAVSIGETILPVLQEVVKGITKFFAWINKLSPRMRKIVGYFMLFGTVSLMLIGKFASIASISLGSIAWPLLAIAGAITAVILITKNWGKITAWLKDVWEGFLNWIGKAIDVLKKILDGVLGFFRKIGEGIKSIFGDARAEVDQTTARLAAVKVSEQLSKIQNSGLILASIQRTFGKSLEQMFLAASPEQASKAGEKLIEAIAQGMDKSGRLLPGTMAKILAIVNEYLPHSPAKRGPLSTLDQVGPGMIETIVKGLEAKKNELIKQGQSLAYQWRFAFEQEAQQPLGDVATEFMSNIGLGDAAKAARDFWNQFTGFLESETGKQLDAALGGILSGSVQMIASAFGGPAGATIAGSIMAGLNVAFKLFGKQRWFKQAFAPLQRAFRDVWRDLRKPFRELSKALEPIMRSLGKLLSVFVKLGAAAFLKPLIEFLSVIANILSTILMPVIDFLNWISNALSNLADWLSGMIDATSFFGSLLSMIRNALAAIWKIIKPIADVVGSFVSFVAKILSAVGGWVGGILRGILGKIFGFAEGGLVQGPGTSKSDNIVARLSPGLLEAINEGKEIPPSYSNVNLTVNVYEATNPQAVVRVIKEELAKARIAVG